MELNASFIGKAVVTFLKNVTGQISSAFSVHEL